MTNQYNVGCTERFYYRTLDGYSKLESDQGLSVSISDQQPDLTDEFMLSTALAHSPGVCGTQMFTCGLIFHIPVRKGAGSFASLTSDPVRVGLPEECLSFSEPDSH